MQQVVPADRVIAEMATKLGEMHRENAILKVQVELLTEAAAAVTPVTSAAGDGSLTAS